MQCASLASFLRSKRTRPTNRNSSPGRLRTAGRNGLCSSRRPRTTTPVDPPAGGHRPRPPPRQGDPDGWCATVAGHPVLVPEVPLWTSINVDPAEGHLDRAGRGCVAERLSDRRPRPSRHHGLDVRLAAAGPLRPEPRQQPHDEVKHRPPAVGATMKPSGTRARRGSRPVPRLRSARLARRLTRESAACHRRRTGPHAPFDVAELVAAR